MTGYCPDCGGTACVCPPQGYPPTHAQARVEWGIDGVENGSDGHDIPGIMRCPSKEVAERLAAASNGYSNVVFRVVTPLGTAGLHSGAPVTTTTERFLADLFEEHLARLDPREADEVIDATIEAARNLRCPAHVGKNTPAPHPQDSKCESRIVRG